MTDQHHLLRAIRDVARMIEKDEPVVADAALAHLFAGTIARMADKEEYLNPTSQARISMLRRSANRQRRDERLRRKGRQDPDRERHGAAARRDCRCA